MKRPRTGPHPLDNHPSFCAVIAAAPHVAELERQLGAQDKSLLGTLTVACGELVHGFAAAPGSRVRVDAHRRAWHAVRQIDRSITAARIHRLAPARVLARAQRAIDRADVMVGALVTD